MQLSLQSFSTLVQNLAAGVQGASRALVDLSVGSVLRATLEACASVCLWLQWIALQVLSMTRASTSSGPDLDSWVGDFALTRMAATYASGVATFSRFTPGQAALVPTGATVITSDGSQTFTVVADPSNAAWNATASGYVVGPTVASVDVPIQALTPGSSGNVQALTISQLATAIAGIDTVSNAAPTAGGVDAESDAALRARFINYINTRSQATLTAVSYAVQGLQQGLDWKVFENLDSSGATRVGNFVVLVDDGSGAPPESLLTAVQAAVEAVRPVGSTFAVLPPQVSYVAVTLTLTLQAGVGSAAIAPLVSSAITSWIDGLGFGQAIPWSRIAGLAYSASSAVQNVSSVQLNGATNDITVPSFGLARVSSVVVS